MQVPEGMDDQDRSAEALAGLADDESFDRGQPRPELTLVDDDADGRINEAMGGMRRGDDC